MFSPRITIGDVYAVAKTLWKKELSGRSPVVGQFEEAFAAYNEINYASAVNSGSSALFLAIKALGLPPGSKVICPAWGYVAAPNAIVQAGHVPVFVDVRIQDGNIDPKLIEGDAQAILCIDTYGVPCDYDALRKFNLPIVQDAAEALGARYSGRRINGDIACFSLWANKTITTGEGGMVVSDNKEYIERVRALKDQCSSLENKYFHDDLGYSLCMGALQASLGLSQLKRANDIISLKRAKHNKLAKQYPAFGSKGLDDWFLINPGCWVFASLSPVFKEEVGDRPFFYPYNHLPMYKDGKTYPVSEYLHEHGSYVLL